MAHGGHMPTGTQRALTISAVLTGVYFVIELGAGILIGSVAVLSDAFHTLGASSPRRSPSGCYSRARRRT